MPTTPVTVVVAMVTAVCCAISNPHRISFHMAYKAIVRVKAKCPKHPRYNPEKQGPGGVKGGCPLCADLSLLHKSVMQLQRLQKAVDTAIAQHDRDRTS